MAASKAFQVGFVFGAKKASSFDKTLAGINKSLSGITKGIGGVMKGMVGFAAAKAGVAGIGDAIDTYKGFEQSMANVKALANLTGAEGEKAYAALKDKAMEMGRKTSKTAQEAADALGYMSLAGWGAEKSMAALEPVLRLSEAGGLDLARTSDLVTDSMSAFGLQADELQNYLDAVAQTSRKSNTSIEQMMEAYNGAGGVLHGLGVKLDEASTALGVLANSSIKGSEAGTALSSLLANLTTGTGQAGKAMQEIGVSAFTSDGEFKGLKATLMELNDKTKSMTQQQRNYYLSMIGGKEQIKTLNALLSGLNTTNEKGVLIWDDLASSVNDASKGSGALTEMATTMNNTMQGAFDRLSSATDDMKIRLVEIAGPYVTPFINALSEKIPNATDVFVKGLQRGVKWLKGIGVHAKAMQDKAVQAFTWVKDKGSMAFQAIREKAIEVKPKFDAFAEAVTDIGSKVQVFIQRGFELAQPAIDWVATKGLPGVVGALGSVFGFATDVYNYFSSNWSLIAPIIAGIVGAFGAYKAICLAVTAAEHIKTGAMLVGKGVAIAVTAVQWAWNAALTANPIGIIVVAIGALVAAGVALAANWDKIKAKAFALWEGIKTALAPIGAWFLGIFDKVKSGFKAFINFVIGGLNWMISGLNKLHVNIPDWVPALGGKTLGFNIPQIPLLAQGGIATAPTLAMVGEGREQEAILPLSKLNGMLNAQPAQEITIVLNPVLPYLAEITRIMRGQKAPTAQNIGGPWELSKPQAFTSQALPASQAMPSITPEPSISVQCSELSDISGLLKKLIDALDKDTPPAPSVDGNEPIQITYAPNVYVYGSANKEQVEAAVSSDYEHFKGFMDRYLRDQRRVTIRR